MPLDVDEDRLWSMMRTQGEMGGSDDMPGSLRREPLTDEDKEFRDWLCAEMESEGLDVRVDAMGNIFGRREGTDPDANPVLTGSHGDSYGGKFDGVLGVVGTLEMVKSLNDEAIETRRPIEIVDWTNEERSRFEPAIMSSGVWAGVYDIEEMYAKTDRDGRTFEEELERIGYKGDVPCEPQYDYDVFLELHTEQGPYLEAKGADVGVVTGIASWHRGEATLQGDADHPGPTPMEFRTDPAVALGDTIVAIRRLADVMGEKTVTTVSRIDIDPNDIRFIADEVTFTWDIRDPSDEVRKRAVERALAEIESAAEREGVDWDWREIVDVPAVICADRCVDAVQTAADRLGLDSVRMPSMALHDASHVANVVDTGMIFAVAEGGKSHNPKEFTSPGDCHSAVSTLANAVVDLADAKR
jgi:N-carbamoyl-L-amino-acid hydrolase